MKILSIETSCDETAVAIVEATGSLDKPKFQVLAKTIHSQIDVHKEFGGVFPSLAKREHAKNIVPVLENVLKSYLSVTPAKAGAQALKNNYKSIDSHLRGNDELSKILEREPGLFEATVKFLNEYEKPEIDMIAVTEGPGLEPALWVGINFARVLSIAWQIPLIGVNHMEGHMASVLLKQNGGKFEARNQKSETNSKSEIRNSKQKKIKFPALALLISGGHTELVEIESWNKYKILGKTRDDAVGESYDKVARLLGFPYPGGPQISQLAAKFREKRKAKSEKNDLEIRFPRPMINSVDLDFSFSGLKTAVLYKIQDLGDKIQDPKIKIQIAGEFEKAIADVLVSKVGNALNKSDFEMIIVAGGVVANEYLRERLTEIATNYGIKIAFPDLADSTDNAQMIACAGYFKGFEKTAKIGLKIKANGGLTYQ